MIYISMCVYNICVYIYIYIYILTELCHSYPRPRPRQFAEQTRVRDGCSRLFAQLCLAGVWV